MVCPSRCFPNIILFTHFMQFMRLHEEQASLVACISNVWILQYKAKKVQVIFKTHFFGLQRSRYFVLFWWFLLNLVIISDIIVTIFSLRNTYDTQQVKVVVLLARKCCSRVTLARFSKKLKHKRVSNSFKIFLFVQA